MAFDGPVENSLVSPRHLVAALHVMLANSPPGPAGWEQRKAAIIGTTRALSSFRVDAETLVRYGMPGRAALPVLLAVIADEELDEFPGLARWRQVLRVPLPPDVSLGGATEAGSGLDAVEIANIQQLLNVWVQNAPFKELITLTPPTADELEAYQLITPPGAEIIAAYTWLWQRSVIDQLDRWTTESLHLEYLWQNGRRVVLFPESVLAVEGPSSGLLNEQIALRAVEPRAQIAESADRLFWQLQEQAVDFLGKGKFAEAAALFEFHHRLYPEDSRSINNLGFCRLPTDPASALHHLQRAEAAGYPHAVINVYNQCCCLHSLNRSGEALDRAEAYWQRQRQPMGGGFIWAKDEDGWRLRSDSDPEVALAELARTIAQQLGLPSRESRWDSRLAEVGLRAKA